MLLGWGWDKTLHLHYFPQLLPFLLCYDMSFRDSRYKYKIENKEHKIFLVIHYRLLQNNQITLLLLIATVTVIIYCYKICFLF